MNYYDIRDKNGEKVTIQAETPKEAVQLSGFNRKKVKSVSLTPDNAIVIDSQKDKVTEYSSEYIPLDKLPDKAISFRWVNKKNISPRYLLIRNELGELSPYALPEMGKFSPKKLGLLRDWEADARIIQSTGGSNLMKAATTGGHFVLIILAVLIFMLAFR